MAVLETAVETPVVCPEEATPVASGSGAVRIAAFGLWGVVGTLLTYGVAQTAIKAAALFS